MRNRFGWITAALATAAVTSIAAPSFASSHREAPAIASDPSADDTDLYAWVDANGNLVVIANFIGLELPDGGPNWAKFSDDVLYEIHVARGPTSLDDAITYQFQFTTAPYVYVPENVGAQSPPTYPATKGQEFFAQLSGGGAFNQTYSVTKITGGKATVVGANLKVPPPNVGPTTNAILNGFTIASGDTYEKHFVDSPATSTIGTLQNGEGRVFAGPRDDPFYADLGAIFDLAQLRAVIGPPRSGKDSAGIQPICTTCTPRDSLRYQNVHTIALEIPGQVANGGTAVTAGRSATQTLGVWASASRRKVTVLRADGSADHYGPWRRVSRVGLPLINEAVIGLQDKDRWNRSAPTDDAPIFGGYFDAPIAARDAQAVGYYANGAPLAVCNIQNGAPPLTNRLADIIPVINLTALDPVYSGIKTIGDVLRVDLGVHTADFPNGRRLDTSGTGTSETVDVVDTELKMLFCTLTNPTVNAAFTPNQFNNYSPYGGIPDGVSQNETGFRSTFPYLASPWEGFGASPHAAPAD